MKQLKKIKILLADDHPLVRIGVRTELEKLKDFKVVGEAKTGREAVKKSILLKPDIILLDISMPDINGLEAASIISKKLSNSYIIALSMHDQENYIREIMKLGAKGYVLKDSPPDELFTAIREVMKGKNYLDKNIREKVKSSKLHQGPGNISKLTNREIEILKNIANGLNNKMIADKFFISVRTVEAHRDAMKKKLAIKSVAELTKFALKNNLIGNEDNFRPDKTSLKKK